MTLHVTAIWTIGLYDPDSTKETLKNYANGNDEDTDPSVMGYFHTARAALRYLYEQWTEPPIVWKRNRVIPDDGGKPYPHMWGRDSKGHVWHLTGDIWDDHD